MKVGYALACRTSDSDVFSHYKLIFNSAYSEPLQQHITFLNEISMLCYVLDTGTVNVAFYEIFLNYIDLQTGIKLGGGGEFLMRNEQKQC